MIVTKIVPALEAEAARFKDKTRELAMTALRKSADGRSITELDARLIRDHEMRSETYLDAARIVEKQLGVNRKANR